MTIPNVHKYADAPRVKYLGADKNNSYFSLSLDFISVTILGATTKNIQ